MADELLAAKELRVADAKRKLAWLEDEYRELQLSPVVTDFIRITRKTYEGWSPEEKSRRRKFRISEEWRYLHCNQVNRIQAHKELITALGDLKEYRRKNNIGRVPMNPSPKSATTNGKHHFLLRRASHSYLVCIFSLRSPHFALSLADDSPDGSPTSVVPSTEESNAFNNQLKSERIPLQQPVPAAELRHRRRAKNEDVSPKGGLAPKKSTNEACVKLD